MPAVQGPTTGKNQWFLCTVGGVLLAIPTMYPSERPVVFLPLVGLGLASFVAAAVRGHAREAATTLWIVVTLNVSYWIPVGLWFAGRHMGVQIIPGPDGGMLAIWFLVFSSETFYALVVFIRGALAGARHAGSQ